MEQRGGDLVLPQGTYVLLQDGASGQVEVVSGPHKVSLADTDKPVIYERETRRFTQVTADRAIRVCPAADEGQYVVLTNPSLENGGLAHPSKGKQPTDKLSMGRRINIQGPDTFALFPGQIADVIDGHQLKSNEYLIIRVYNEELAKENLKNAVVKGTEGESVKKNLFDSKEIRTGNLLIIKGTDVSFYIPPTGIEVLEESGTYTRNAVTLERLEYCILLDQNGDKRYVIGPDVVFPKPTESFISNKNKRIFKAIELNENMGLYIKVIADYTEGEGEDAKSYKAGNEIFLTGNDQKIYYPRAEHAIIKYGDETIYYSTAVPKGEGRYVLDKINGDVKLVSGPKMLLPDPRTEVIVKRVLDDKTVQLWFPGNNDARKYNQELNASMDMMAVGDDQFSNRARSFYNAKSTLLSSDVVGDMMEEMDRKTNYTKPRTIKLDTKYEGAVSVNVWPNYAVQVVNKTGKRNVIEGPKVFMLAYDESLEVLAFSTGKPKTDHNLMKSVYLQTKNNVVSDLITVETKDLINVDVRLSYKVNFEGDSRKWFGVSDYVKLLSQHMRSIIRNAVKKISIEEFNDNSTDIIRDTILGKTEKAGKRVGRKFEENGMEIYDVEVLNIEIDDHTISSMLIDSQHSTVEQNLQIIQLTKELAYTKKKEELNRARLDEKQKTTDKNYEVRIKELESSNTLDTKSETYKANMASSKVNSDLALQEAFDLLATSRLNRDKAKSEFEVKTLKEKTDIGVNKIEKEMAAIQPGLIEAMVVSGNAKLADSLAKNLKAQRGGLGDLFGGGGFSEILKTIEGTPLEGQLKGIMTQYNDLKKTNKKE